MSRQTQQSFANRSQTFVGGTGPGGDAVSPLTRSRDIEAYERMKVGLPKKPPSRQRPREATESTKTDVAEVAV